MTRLFHRTSVRQARWARWLAIALLTASLAANLAGSLAGPARNAARTFPGVGSVLIADGGGPTLPCTSGPTHC